MLQGMISPAFAPSSSASAIGANLLPPEGAAPNATAPPTQSQTETLAQTEGLGVLGAQKQKNNFAGIDAAQPGSSRVKLASAEGSDRRLGNTQAQLFVQGQNDALSIDPNDIRQGTAATCTIMAAAGGLANTARGRMALTRILRDTDNGNVTVTLWNKPMSISVDKIKTMPARVGDFNGKPNDPRWEIWPKAMEAGFARGAKYLFNRELYRKPIDANEGAPIGLALKAVTNQPVTVKPLVAIAPKDTLATLGRELNRDKLVLAATHNNDGVEAYGLVPRHAYAVLGVNSSNNSVELFDPHGKKLSVSLDVFRRCFNHVGWSQIP
jgi:hypothetical protein